MTSELTRREFVRAALAAGLWSGVPGWLPAYASPLWEASARVGAGTPGPVTLELAVRAESMEIAGGVGSVISLNHTIPGPLVELYEGHEARLRVTNHLAVDSSIHWHGLLLPFEMDGVPGVTFPGIRPGETFEALFPVRQAGTYWYHSHSGLQEQSGVYGPLVIHPAAPQAHPVERDYVVVLSDWTFEDPRRVLAKLKKKADYYNYDQPTLVDLLKDDGETGWRAALRARLDWGAMRMSPADIADVTGATYSYLLNGVHPAGNWTGLFRPGERVRLRLINASAMTYFNVRIPGLPMTVVAADGPDVRPVEVDELQIAVAETYDVIVEPEDRAYTLFAESMDRSGYAMGTLAPREGMRAEVPALREPPRRTMADMGMDHGAMAGGEHAGHAAHRPAPAPADPHAHHRMPSKADPHAGHMGHAASPDAMPAADPPGSRLSERGAGLESVGHRVLTYADLRNATPLAGASRRAGRELELHLTGNMERYMWSFDGQKFSEVDGPIEFEYGERLRLVLVNDTMMEHPIHLHGMFMELDNGAGERRPLKHTLSVKPAERVSLLIDAVEPGRWAFHCHLLYHMEMGMMRVVRVSDPVPNLS